MAAIDNDDVEVEARDLLRGQIQDLPWYPDLPEDERRERIERDVERYWHLKSTEAAQRFIDQLWEMQEAQLRTFSRGDVMRH